MQVGEARAILAEAVDQRGRIKIQTGAHSAYPAPAQKHTRALTRKKTLGACELMRMRT